MTDQLLTMPQAAERLQVSLSTLRRIIDKGELPIVKINSRNVRVRPEDLDTYIEAKIEGAPK